MAKIVYACVRDIAHAPRIKRKIEAILGKLLPDNIPDARCKLENHGRIIYGISAHTDVILEKGSSVCMGMVYDNPAKWWRPMADHPEGSYAIFRADDEYVEAITDMACSRAVWYYKDENIFIAGTSQRAVINVAGRFEFDKRNVPWILSSGMLAPSLSWCKNVHFVDPDGSVLLNRKTWEITATSVKPEFQISRMPDKQFQQEFKDLLANSFSNIDIDLSKWILPISGGYDSRGIACLLKAAGKDIASLNAVTWGVKASEKIKHSDGYLGGAVAKSLGMQHEFRATDNAKEPIEIVFDRFIQSCEGRIDHISGYTDGMAIWKNISESGKDGIIRGDETFGGPPSNTFARGRFLTGCKLCSDFSNLQEYEQYGFEKQVIPEHLLDVPGMDTPALYRDRLYQQFRMPFTMSALSDVKYAYTEMLNPFLTRKIILHSRTLPDHLRHNKILCKRVINEISPNIPYASEEATNLKENILKTPAAVKLFCRELGSAYIRQLFPEELLAKVITKLQTPSVPVNSGLLGKLKIVLRKNVPVAIKENLRTNMPKPILDTGVLAFRIYTAGKMYKMLTEDIKTADKDFNEDLSDRYKDEQLQTAYATHN